MEKPKIEKDWITKSGLRAIVLMTTNGHRCGYVGVRHDNRFFGVDYMTEIEKTEEQK